ncbi:MAG: nitroreductase family protein [Chloroflexota bacterium]|nr:nitroreductase family protein [Chloroflexota bacterium]
MAKDASSAQRLTAFLRGLRAVRNFSPLPISEDVLHDILEVARWTGSSKNSQPWHLVVVRDRSTLAQLARCGPYAGHLAGAQAAIVLVMDDGKKRFDEGRLAQAIMLAAWAHGVGSCIGSLYPQANTERARRLLGVPPNRWLHTAISLGYPRDANALRLSASRAGLSEVPLGRAALADLVSWERMSAPQS